MREDTTFLDKLVSDKLLSYEEARYISSLPLLVLSGEIKKELPRNFALQGELYYWENPLFTEFVVLYREENKSKYCVFKYVDGHLRGASLAQVTNPFYWVEMAFNSTGEPEEEGTNVRVKPGLKLDANDLGVLTKTTFAVLGIALEFLNNNHRKDLYAVGVKSPNRGKTLRQRQLGKDSGPSIVFLNRLPKPSVKSQGEPTYSVAAHHRRGYFKTLRDECFANHPKYLVERGIYVKPAWIGDRQSIVNGTTYTVLEK